MIEIDKLYITNYSHPNCTPLKNIMRLSEKEAYETAYELACNNKNQTAFWRFSDFHNYYPLRKKVDQLLYDKFIELGGQPQCKHPLSFVFQESDFLFQWFDQGTIIKIPLKQIPSEYISFTYGDSMASHQRHGDFTLITKEQLLKNLSDYAGSLEQFMKEIDETYRYIEVQVWNDEYCVTL